VIIPMYPYFVRLVPHTKLIKWMLFLVYIEKSLILQICQFWSMTAIEVSTLYQSLKLGKEKLDIYLQFL